MAREQHHRLNPTALTRIRQALQPDWIHTVTARRVAAAALVAVAAVAALRADPHGQRRPVLVATHDLAPGTALSADDLATESRLAATLPDGSTEDKTALLGSTVAGPVRRGEVLTDVRVLGPRLAESAAGPGARVVPLHLSENAVLDVVRAGDVVDVLGAPTSDPGAAPRLLATDAIVVLVSEAPKGLSPAAERVVLLALPAATANTVAAASLVQAVTVTLH